MTDYEKLGVFYLGRVYDPEVVGSILMRLPKSKRN